MPRPAPPPDSNRDRARIARHVARLMRLMDGRRRLPQVAVLAADLGVCPRTVTRYLDAIEQAGWPVPRRRYADEEAA